MVGLRRNDSSMQFVQSISCVLFLIATLEASTARNSTIVLPIVGFFPWESKLWPEGIQCIPAVLQAVEEINQRTDIIPGYHLSLTYYEYDGCAANGAVRQYIEGVANNKTAPIALIAPGCSSAALKIASLTSQPGRNLVQVSYGATNPSLSIRSAYPYFLRTVPNQLNLTNALAEFVTTNNWTRIAAIYQGVDTILRSTAYSFRNNLPHLDCPLYSIQERDESLVSGELEITLKQIKQNSNIIFAFVRYTLIDDIMETAHKLDMSNQNYVWVFPEQYRQWWNCSNCKRSWYNDSVYLFDSQYLIGQRDDTVILPSKNTFSKYEKLQEDRIDTFFEENPKLNRSSVNTSYRHSSYDTMWAIALGLNLTQKSLSERNMSLHDYQKDPQLVSDTLLEMLRHNVSFEGASGKISFERGSTEAPVVLQQIVMNGTDKVRQEAYVYSNGTLKVFNVTGHLPQDRFKEIIAKIHVGEFVVILLVTVLFVVLNSALVFINVRYKNYRIIRSTSPNLNLFLFSGHYMLLLFVVILSIINFFPDKLSNLPFALACNFSPWLLTVGFSLVLVTLFVKYCRLYVIFSAKRKTIVHNKLSDRMLMTCIVGIILVADVIPMVVLNAVNPLEKHTHVDIDSVIGSENSTFTCGISGTELEVFYVMIGWILLIKALLALSLFYFTFKLRNITVYDDLFNDSGSVFTFMFLELILLVVCTIFLVLPRAPNDIYTLYYALTLGILLTLASAIVILFGYKYRKFREKISRLCSRRRAKPLVSPEPLNHNVVIGQLRSPTNVTPWHSRYRYRQSLLSMYSSPSTSPRTSVNSVRFSPSPPEVNLYTNPCSARGSHGFAGSRDSSASSLRYNFNPYFS